MTDTPVKSAGQWFVIKTVPNKERSVKRYLDRYLRAEEMTDYIYEILVPLETVTEVKGGKKSTKVRTLYPGYVFIHMRIYDEDGKILQKPWYYVNGADGARGFVGGQTPSPLKESDVKEILARTAEAEGKEVPKVSYEVGEEVRITDGPFQSLTGRIESVDPERGKLKVSVSIFGRFTPVDLEYWQVERVVAE